MTIIGVIPSRWGSTRFPGKSLAPVGGKPLVQWVYERAARATALDRLLVATDDERIRDAVRGFGGEVAMTREDHPSGTDRIAEAIAGTDADIVVNIQGDEPLIDPELVDRLAGVLRDGPEWDMATAAVPITDPADIGEPSVVKVVADRGGRALYFSRSVIPHIREKDSGLSGAGPIYWRHIGIYGYRRPFLEQLVATPPCVLEQAEKLEQLRALYLGGRMKVIEAESMGPGIDTPADVAKAEAAMRAMGLL